jgi:esterase/lipase
VFLTQNSLSNPIIFGYSMGGYVAIYHSLYFSNKSEKIITLGTKFSWTTESATKETKMLNAEMISEKVPQFARQLKLRHGEEYWRMVLNKTASMMIEMGMKNPISIEDLKDLEIQVRFGLGDKDQMVSIDETVLFYKATRNGSFYVLPDTQHPIEKVRTEELVYQIKQYCK